MNISERTKQNLLWAYDDFGSVDADMFLTILRHEGVKWEQHELTQLVEEMGERFDALRTVKGAV